MSGDRALDDRKLSKSPAMTRPRSIGQGMPLARICDQCNEKVFNMLGTTRKRRGKYEIFNCAKCATAKATGETQCLPPTES